MPFPQPVLAPSGPHQYHLEFVFRPGATPADLVPLVAAVWNPSITGNPNPGEGPEVQPSGGGTAVVVGFGPEVWEALAPGTLPRGFGPAVEVRTVEGAVGVPATQRDLWVWLNGSDYSTVLAAAVRVVAALHPALDVVHEQHCFVLGDSRTWEGFIDGTENPGPFEAPADAFVADGEPGAGSSTVIVQRWISSGLADFDALTLDEQQAVFGRTKRDSVELDDLPANSHVARNVLEVDGEELHIVRRNAPFGSVTERGYLFVGFAADQTRVTRMLERMYGVDGAPDSVPDALTRYTHPVSSSSYLVPPFDALAAAGIAPVDE